MPNITLYLDNTTFVLFQSLEWDKQRELRNKCTNIIKTGVKNEMLENNK